MIWELVDNSVAHTHTPCGWQPWYASMSPGLGWLTHTSDRLWRLDSGWGWDMLFFDTQGVCKDLQYFWSKKRNYTNLFFSSPQLDWDEVCILGMRLYMIYSHDHVAWRSRIWGLSDAWGKQADEDSSQALGATGLRSVRWKYQDAFMIYAPLRMEEKSTTTCDHTTCARNDHKIGKWENKSLFPHHVSPILIKLCPMWFWLCHKTEAWRLFLWHVAYSHGLFGFKEHDQEECRTKVEWH